MTSAPRAAVLTAAWSSASTSIGWVPAGTRAARPGRTRLVTVQPASRNASAALWPSRPPAPSTRTRELMAGGRGETAWASAGHPGAAGKQGGISAGNVAFVFILGAPAIVNARLAISNPADLNGRGRYLAGPQLKVGQWPYHLEDVKRSPDDRSLGLCFRADRDRCRRCGAGPRPRQHDARRLAAQIAEADEASRAAAIHRHHRHNADGLGDGQIEHKQAWRETGPGARPDLARIGLGRNRIWRE